MLSDNEVELIHRLIDGGFEAVLDLRKEFFHFALIVLVKYDIGVAGERVEFNAYQIILLFWIESFFADKAGESVDESKPLFGVLQWFDILVSRKLCLYQLIDELMLDIHWN